MQSQPITTRCALKYHKRVLGQIRQDNAFEAFKIHQNNCLVNILNFSGRNMANAQTGKH